MAVLRAFPLDIARRAVRHWSDAPGRVELIAHSGNSVYRMELDGRPVILRLSDPNYRTKAQNEAECDFLLHLARAGLAVSTAIADREGQWVLATGGEDNAALASVFRWAPGVQVRPGSEHWKESFFREWGIALGRIHRQAQAYEPGGPARRWDWRDEMFFARAESLIPADDTPSLRELDTLLNFFATLDRRADNFGMIHADFAPQNFNFHPDLGITAFDFGNCCYHWFAADLAISLSTLRRRPERDQLRAWLLEGYRSTLIPDEDVWRYCDQFLRLRVLYVYLSRLWYFGADPTAAEREILLTLRRAVHEAKGW